MNRIFSSNDLIFILLATRWTVLLSLIAFAGGACLGLLVALGRVSERSPVRFASASFIRLFQNTPLLMQLFLVYFGVSIIGLNIDPLAAAALGLILNAAAFLGEIWRGCIQAIPSGQDEAGRALGLRSRHRMRLIILPQAFRIAIAPTVGFMVQIIKSTSLASAIGFVELARSGQIINNSLLEPFPIFVLIAATYFAICYPLSRLSRRLEARSGFAPVEGGAP